MKTIQKSTYGVEHTFDTKAYMQLDGKKYTVNMGKKYSAPRLKYTLAILHAAFDFNQNNA